MAEIIDISSIGENATLNIDEGLTSSNFGPGIELLMNDKKPSGDKGGSSDINLDDLTNLEQELNDAVGMGDDEPAFNLSSGDNIKIESETFNSSSIGEPLNVKFDTGDDSRLGVETLNSGSDNKTWDGYGKFNEIPIDPTVNMPSNKAANMSKEELLKEKFNYLKKLEGLERKGVELTKKYTMDSSLQEMMGEYEMVIAEKEKENSIKFQGNMLSAVINEIGRAHV